MNYEKFYALLNNLVDLFDRLLHVESDKLDAIAVNDIEKLDEYMKTEQAFTLEMRSLDQKREALQEEMGLKGLTISQIIEKAPADQKEKLDHYRNVLIDKKEELELSLQCTRKFIEMHIVSLDVLISQLGPEKQETAGYEKDGKAKEEDNPKFTSKKV